MRTHRIDLASIAAYDRYSAVAYADVIFACDERIGPIEASDRNHVGYDEVRLGRMGLYAHPQCGWRCGDYQYYVLRTDKPEYDEYWLIEPDVFINTSDINGFFSSFRSDTADFLAARYGPRDAQWDWHRHISRHFPDVFGCVFPVTRLTGRAIDYLFTLRRHLSRQPDTACGAFWPNDESFTATALSAARFTCSDLNAPGRLVRTEVSLRTGVAHDPGHIASLAPDGLIYHPVRPVAPVLLDAERRLRVVAERVRSPAQMRAHVMWLLRTAETCVRDGARAGAALGPMVVAAQSVTRLQAAANDARADLGTDLNLARKADKLLALFKRRFGVFDGDTCVGTAHVAVSRLPWRSSAPASPDDFRIDVGHPIRRLGVGFALPYALNMTENTLLLTLHTAPAEHLAAPVLHMVQRDYCAAIALVPWEHLAQMFGRVRPDVELIFVLPAGNDLTFLDQSLRQITNRFLAAPSVLSQLGGARRRVAQLPASIRTKLIRSAIVPFLDVPAVEDRRGSWLIRLDRAGVFLAPDLAAVFPSSTFICVEEGGKHGVRLQRTADRLVSLGAKLHRLRPTDVGPEMPPDVRRLLTADR